MKDKRIGEWLVRLLFVLQGAIVVAQLLGADGLVRALFTLTFPATGLLWLWSVRYGLQKTDWLTVAAATLAVVCVLVDLALCGGSFSLPYLRKVVMMGTTLLFLQTAYRLRVEKETALWIHGAAEVAALVFAAVYVLCRREVYTFNDLPVRYAAFGFSNPNLAAMFLTCIYMLEFICTVRTGHRVLKLLRGALTAALGWFVAATTSRNGLLAMALFTVLAAAALLWERMDGGKLRIGKVLAALIAVFPALFATAYMTLIGSDWLQSAFSFLASEGKQLDSRVKEWQPALETIHRSPLIGSYYTISDGTGASQMHNTHMDLAASYGIPVLVLVCVLLAVYLHQQGKRYRDTVSLLYMAGFVCALMLGLFEAALFSGGLGIYILMGAFLLMASQGESARERRYIL